MENKKNIFIKISKYVALFMSAFVIYSAVKTPLVVLRQRSLMLMCSIFIAFILYPGKDDEISVLDILFSIISMVVSGYILFNFDNLIMRMGRPTNLDITFGIIAIIAVLEATRRTIGNPLTIISGLFLLYAKFGNWIPGMFGHRGYSLSRIVSQQYLSAEGIFGVPVGVIVSIVFLFIIFGKFLELSGGGEFFIDLAVSIAGTLKGGPAKIAILSSGLMGTINGSSLANVATTGTFTIPLMKKTGYDPDFAGSVEATASTGGQIMPPIMGAGAFVMAEITGIPYLTIIKAAAIPALLYFFSVYMNVHFEACYQDLEGMKEEDVPNTLDVLKEGYVFILPVVGLIVILVMGYSPARSAIVGMILLIVSSMFKKATRMSFLDIMNVLEEAGKTIVPIMMACAAAGMIVGTVNQTGLGIKFSLIISGMTGGYVIVALFLTMVACIILGMSLPTTANYIVQSAITAPALVELGIPLIAAHLFVFYYGIFADITPPVCLAAYTAASIAGGDPIRTGLNATRNVTVNYIIPYLFVFFPALIGRAAIPVVIWTVITSMLAVVAFSAAFSKFLYTVCSVSDRIILLIAGSLLIMPEPISDFVGGGILLFVFLKQYRSVPQESAQNA